MLKGKHWICFLRSHKDYIELFDSLGVDDDKKALIKRYCKIDVKKLKFNESSFQDKNSDTCGKFVLYYAIERMHNLDLDFEEILEDLFDKNNDKNEEIVKKFYDFCVKEHL